MPIYNVTVAGRKSPVLIKAESASKAKDAVVDVKALTAEEMADALASGKTVWNPETDFPVDDAAE